MKIINICFSLEHISDFKLGYSAYFISTIFVLMECIQLWSFDLACHGQKGLISVAKCMSLHHTSAKSQFKIAERWPVKKKKQTTNKKNLRKPKYNNLPNK